MRGSAAMICRGSNAPAPPSPSPWQSRPRRRRHDRPGNRDPGPAGRADSEVPESDMARVHWQAPAKVASGCATRPRHVVVTALDSLQQADTRGC